MVFEFFPMGYRLIYRLLIPKFSSKPDLSLELEKLFQLPIRYLVSENILEELALSSHQ